MFMISMHHFPCLGPVVPLQLPQTCMQCCLRSALARPYTSHNTSTCDVAYLGCTSSKSMVSFSMMGIRVNVLASSFCIDQVPLQGKGRPFVPVHEHPVLTSPIAELVHKCITHHPRHSADTSYSAALRDAYGYDAMHLNSQTHDSSNYRGCMMILVAVQQFHLRFGLQQHW
jgi:hypothetical protein